MEEISAKRSDFATGISLLLPVTLSTMAIILLAPILPQLQAQFADAPGAEYLVPMILTVPALCVALLSPVAGILGDYFGRRRLLMLSLLVYGVVGVAPVFLTSIWAILASRIGVGITEALIMTLSTTMIGDYFHGERRDKWLAAQTAFGSLSALLFFNVGGLLGTIGWRAPFWVYASALLMLLAVVAFTREPGKDKGEAGHERHLHNVSWAGFPWLSMAGIIAVTIFASVLFYTVQIQTAPGLVILGLDNPAQIGFLTSIASIGVPLGTLIYSRVPLTPVRWLLLIEFSIFGIGFMAMSNAQTVPAFIIGCALNQVGAGMILPTLLVWAMSQLAFEVRARGTGVWQSAFALGQWLSPIAITIIASRAGGLLPSFSWLSFIAIGAAVLTLLGYFIARGGGGNAPKPVEG